MELENEIRAEDQIGREMESAITIHEESRIPNRRFDSEEVNFQALIDTDRLPDEARVASIVNIVHIVRLLFVILLRKVKSNPR
ncbi:hypothetical protein AVEN_83467-1 [Araneus ventricosus]|uniref:Uncharacterized protein n=1 Tax=Araneus ventricosus TaxID=182803 RepID=A0A4Y2JNC0_ARAVE|nr:hypothetical protein AVEN_83467-1 [Araneus ventricosus]